MKEKLLALLIKQRDKGNDIKVQLESISNITELNKLDNDYEEWDKTNCEILEKAYVHQQLFRMYSGINHLGNVYVDNNSFQAKRDRIIYCLPRKLVHLNTAINHTQDIRNIDLLPIDFTVITSTQNNILNTNNMKKLFISHSSIDKLKVEALIDLIEDIGVSHTQIFFSSNPAYGVNLGQNIFERLKTELTSDIFALFILSENFYKSPVCLCEMGAVWIKSNKQIPVLIPPFDFGNVQGVFPNTLGFKMNDRNQLNSFKTELETYFELTPIHFSRWENKRDEYLTKISSLL